MKRNIKSGAGFTLIELLVVMTVIAVLTTIVLYGLAKAQAAARDVQREQIMKAVQGALESFYNDKGSYPNNTNCAPVWTAGGLFASICLGAYLGAPTDPNYALDDPGCGDGVKSDVRGNGAPCPPVTYSYIFTADTNCPNAGFTLKLTKESGGVGYLCGVR